MSDAVLERKMLSPDGRGEVLPWSRLEWATDDGETERPSANAGFDGEAVLEKIAQRLEIRRRPKYSRTLLVVFVVSSLTTIAALLGLLASPLYTGPDTVIVLLAVAGIGMGILAIVVRRAAKTADR
jgi:hypothetical protein